MIRSGAVARLAAVAAAALLSSRMAAAPGRPADRVWVGPMPFVSDRTFRSDYLPTLLDERLWPAVLKRTRVLKSYLMVLPADPVPGKRAPEASDEQLRALARFVRRHRLKVAFEVGGIRMAADTPCDQAGETTARGELRHLRRWLKAGGRIDYLTTDHAVMMTVGAPYVNPKSFAHRGMTVSDAIGELADYFAIMHRAIPGARLGIIESLGFFTVDAGSRTYPRTVPALPVWRFDQFIAEVAEAMHRRGLRLDHFHVDFGWEGVRHDGLGKPDCGRILAVEAAVRRHGVRPGVIINAFHDGMAANPDPAEASRQAVANTLRFTDAYLAAGGAADHLVVQTWQPYPDRTGPETDANTVLGLANAVLDRLPLDRR
ncbi:MAG: hypothetical protein NT029_17825 [Armatimonadetes bacterium]|nr:hypothetical protein [Armatimonadota bacterium]